MPVNNLIQFRRGTDWSIDPVLSGGEPGFDTTNNILKIGDGVKRWSELIAINTSGSIGGSGTFISVTGSPALSYINITGVGSSVVFLNDNLLIISGVDGFSFRGYEDVTSLKTVFNIGQNYNSGNLNVYYNGLKLLINEDYYANGGSSFELVENAISGDIVEWVGGYTGSSFFQDIGGSGTTNYITKWSDKNTLTSGIIYDNGINIGIGTSSPQYKLDVVGSGSFDSLNINNAFTFPTADGASGQLLTSHGNGLLYWDSLDIKTDTSPQLGGNLDINGYSITGIGSAIIDSGNFDVLNTDKLILTSGNSVPSNILNSLYNLSGNLYYNTSPIAILPSGGTANQILQKINDNSYDLQWIDNYAIENRVYVKNTTGFSVTKGQAVYISGAQGDHPVINLSIASAESTSSKTLGLLRQDLNNNEFGYVVSEGIITGVNTNAASAAGDTVWLSPTTPGGLVYGLANKPYAPNHMVFIGYVLRKNVNEGVIFVKPQNGYELEELHNVAITGVSNGQFLQYNSSSGLWIGSSSGNFTSLSVNGTGVSVVGHTHVSTDITNFNSSVSGLVSGIYAPLIGTLDQFASTTSSQLSSVISDETGSGLLVFNDNPILTGIPLVPTATSGTNTNQIASTAFVRTEISNLVNSAPSTLDTLNELASALGNDANFSTTVTNSLAGKANLNGAVFTGAISGPSGDFVVLKQNGTVVSISGHSHTTSDISNFNSGVSGILPVKNIVAGSGIFVSATSGVFTVHSTQIPVTGAEILSAAKDTFSVPEGYIPNNLNVYINGAKLLINNDYIASNGSTFILTQTAISGDIVEWQGVGGSAEYATLNHQHTTTDITNFNSGVSGLLTVTDIIPGSNISINSSSGIYTISSTAAGGGFVNNYGSDRVLVSDGTTTGINAQNSLTFNGSLLTAPSGSFTNRISIGSTNITANDALEILNASNLYLWSTFR